MARTSYGARPGASSAASLQADMEVGNNEPVHYAGLQDGAFAGGRAGRPAVRRPPAAGDRREARRGRRRRPARGVRGAPDGRPHAAGADRPVDGAARPQRRPPAPPVHPGRLGADAGPARGRPGGQPQERHWAGGHAGAGRPGRAPARRARPARGSRPPDGPRPRTAPAGDRGDQGGAPDGGRPLHERRASAAAPPLPEAAAGRRRRTGRDWMIGVGLDRRTKVLVTIGVMLALLLASLDQTIVGTAMPRIISELNGLDRYAWVTTAYLVTSTVMTPIAGKLGDLFGRKPFILTGIVGFMAMSWLCGASQDMNQLVFFRGAQGLFGGMLFASVFTVVADIFPPEQRARMQGLFGSVFGISSIFGPTLGGWITDHLGWRWVFFVNVPVGVLAIALIAATLPFVRSQARLRDI